MCASNVAHILHVRLINTTVIFAIVRSKSKTLKKDFKIETNEI